jgi:hypothetical protein
MSITVPSTQKNNGVRRESSQPDATRSIARRAGWLYLITFIASLPTLPLKTPLKDANFVLGTGSTTGVALAAWLDIVCALAGVGTAVVLWPVIKRHNQTSALGFVASRTIEATLLFAGALSDYTLITLRTDVAGTAGADNPSLLTAGHTLKALHDWSFLLGPGIMPGVNALLLATVMYRTGLVPRIIPLMGLIGAPLLLISATATMFGLWDQLSVASGVATVPIFFWELSLGCWMAFKGFKPAAVAALDDAR